MFLMTSFDDSSDFKNFKGVALIFLAFKIQKSKIKGKCPTVEGGLFHTTRVYKLRFDA